MFHCLLRNEESPPLLAWQIMHSSNVINWRSSYFSSLMFTPSISILGGYLELNLVEAYSFTSGEIFYFYDIISFHHLFMLLCFILCFHI